MRKLLKAQAFKEIVISIAVLSAYRMMLKVPLPFVNLSEYSARSITFGSPSFGDTSFGYISITALGIMPFVSACMTIEILLLLSEIVTKHGIGNGISLLVLSGASFGVFEDLSRFIFKVSVLQINFFSVFIFSIINIFLFVYIPIYLLKATFSMPLKHNSDQSFSHFFKLSQILSGKAALFFASSVSMIPVTFFFTERSGFLAKFFEMGTLGNYLLSCALVVMLSYSFGWLFLHPERRMEKLKSWGWKSQETHQSSVDFIKRKFLILNLPWSLFLCGVILLPGVALTTLNLPFYIGGSSIFTISFLSLDFLARIKLWNRNINQKPYKMAEFHDVHYATMIKNHLKRENVQFYLQGYYHRHLLYFFGPYIPINLMVPNFEKDRASKIIERYYGGIGLMES